MTQPWAPERIVDVDLARALVESQFRELAPVRIESFGEGWDNVAYLVDAEIVFRFPQRAIAVPLIEAEARVLPRIAPRLPLPVPVPRWIGAPSDAYPWPFAGYARLAGTTADRAVLDASQRAGLAAPLGAFLSALHAIDPDEVGAPADTLARADLGRRMPILRERLARIAAIGAIDDASPWLRLLDTTEIPAPSDMRVLAHGDMYARHLLVDDHGAACGVIDWGDVHAGDPAVDLGIAYGLLPAAGRAAFFDAYTHPVDERMHAFARVKALFHAVALVDYGCDVGDDALVREGRAGLAHVLE